MVSISANVLAPFAGLMGVLLGALIGPYMNHRFNVKYNRRDFLFKKKIEYFEKQVACIEQNIKLYKKEILSLKPETKNIQERIEEIKKQRIHFSIMSSPLYFNTNRVSKTIVSFVAKEKEIFKAFEDLERERESSRKEKIISYLNKELKDLRALGNKSVSEMKKELH